MADSSLPISSIKLHCKFNEISNVHLVVSRRRIKWLIDWLASFLLYNVRLRTLSWPPSFLRTSAISQHRPAINADVFPTWTELQNFLYILGWVVESQWMRLTGALIPSFRTSEASNLVKSAHLPVSTHYSSTLVDAAGRLMFCRIKQICGDTTNHASTETHSIQPPAAEMPQSHHSECFPIHSH